VPDEQHNIPEDESNLGETVGRLFGLIVRRRWWILLPACGTALAVVAVLQKIPNRYTSEATLLVVSQQVPERYVVPNSTTDLSAALQAMKREVLSRAQLLKIIDDFGLYPKKAKRVATETLVELMLGDIDIQPLDENPVRRDFSAFKISFIAEAPALAQEVTSTLTSLFINENLRTREEQATNTTRFLHEQVEAKRKKLEEQEQLLRDFKMQHVGELPEQQQGNLGILTGLQNQLQNATASLSHAQEQRVYLEAMLSGYRHQVNTTDGGVRVVAGSPSATRVVSPVEAAESDLARLQSARAALLSRYTPEHPDVVKIEREITKAEGALQRLRVATPTPHKEESPVASAKAASRPAPPVEPADDPAVAQIKSQLEANRVEMDNLAQDEKQLKARIAQYENRVNQTPVREQQQAALARDTEALRQEFADLLKKEQESQLATNLEKQQGGQQFRLVDPASLPAVPSSPKRLKLSGGGAAAGLFLGLALAFVMEMKHSPFYTEKELTERLSPPLVLSIPLLPTPAEERARIRKGAFEWLAGSALVLVVLIAEFYVYRAS